MSSEDLIPWGVHKFLERCMAQALKKDAAAFYQAAGVRME